MNVTLMNNERLTVRSKDGVEISVQKAGSGPALLLVHGALLNGSLSWGAVMPKLAGHLTVYAMDRRGRAPSGDAPAYSIVNESDDIVAVAQKIGGPLTLLAHSYGALASLDALDRLKNVSRLILYEPPVTAEGARPDSDAVLEKLDQALAANDREQLVMTFLRDQVRTPPDRLARMKSSPIWPTVLEIAHTLPRESRAVNTYRPFNERLANWKVPTTIFLGSESVGLLRDAAYYVRDYIPGSQIVILEGQGHGANLEAPDYFVMKVLEVAH
jgi:pimeloyl-ACP methyl ester carboxylesterase